MGQTLDREILTIQIPDISTADTVYVPVPFSGKLKKMKTCLGGAITVADADITINVNGGSTELTITVATSGSAAGVIDSGEMDVAVTEGDYLAIATDGASSTAAEVVVTVEISRLTH